MNAVYGSKVVVCLVGKAMIGQGWLDVATSSAVYIIMP